MSIRLFADDINICLESSSHIMTQPLHQQYIDSIKAGTDYQMCSAAQPPRQPPT